MLTAAEDVKKLLSWLLRFSSIVTMYVQFVILINTRFIQLFWFLLYFSDFQDHIVCPTRRGIGLERRGGRGVCSVCNVNLVYTFCCVTLNLFVYSCKLKIKINKNSWLHKKNKLLTSVLCKSKLISYFMISFLILKHSTDPMRMGII